MKSGQNKFWIFAGLAIISFMALTTLSPQFNLKVSKQFANIKCKLGTAKMCHLSAMNDVPKSHSLPYLNKNCYKRNFAPSCYAASKILEAKNDPRHLNLLLQGCFSGNTKICRYTSQKAFELWQEEESSDKEFHKGGKFLTMAFNAVTHGCALRDQQSCQIYSQYWSNLYIQKVKNEYECINNKKESCKELEKITKRNEKINWLDQKYFSLKTLDYTSVSCRVHVTEPQIVQADQRAIASKNIFTVDLFADLKSDAYSIELQPLEKGQDNSELQTIIKTELLDLNFAWLVGGYKHFYKRLQFASQKGPWIYFQNSTLGSDAYNVTFHEKTGDHFNSPLTSDEPKKVIRYHTIDNKFYPRELTLTAKDQTKNDAYTKYAYTWQQDAKLRWPSSITSTYKEANGPTKSVNFNFEHCLFNKINDSHKMLFSH